MVDKKKVNGWFKAASYSPEDVEAARAKAVEWRREKKAESSAPVDVEARQQQRRRQPKGIGWCAAGKYWWAWKKEDGKTFTNTFKAAGDSPEDVEAARLRAVHWRETPRSEYKPKERNRKRPTADPKVSVTWKPDRCSWLVDGVMVEGHRTTRYFKARSDSPNDVEAARLAAERWRENPRLKTPDIDLKRKARHEVGRRIDAERLSYVTYTVTRPNCICIDHPKAGRHTILILPRLEETNFDEDRAFELLIGDIREFFDTRGLTLGISKYDRKPVPDEPISTSILRRERRPYGRNKSRSLKGLPLQMPESRNRGVHWRPHSGGWYAAVYGRFNTSLGKSGCANIRGKYFAPGAFSPEAIEAAYQQAVEWHRTTEVEVLGMDPETIRKRDEAWAQKGEEANAPKHTKKIGTIRGPYKMKKAPKRPRRMIGPTQWGRKAKEKAQAAEEKAKAKEGKAEVEQERADVGVEKVKVKEEKAEVNEEKADVGVEKVKVKQEKVDVDEEKEKPKAKRGRAKVKKEPQEDATEARPFLEDAAEGTLPECSRWPPDPSSASRPSSA